MKILFIIILFLSINEVSSKKKISDQKTNWLDAQHFCRNHGMLSKAGRPSLDEQDSGKYWTRHYTKRSDWIHFLGCFDQDTIRSHATSNLTILDITVVKCQLLCLPDSETFGIQGNSCFCLSRLDPHVQRLNIKWCNLLEEKFPFGNNSIFIYKNTEFNAIRSDRTDATNQEDLCVQILCVKSKVVKFTMANCKSIGNALCTNKVLLGNYTWPKAMQKCVEQSTSADYLKADIDLHVNPASSDLCTNYNNSFTGSLWLGIQSSILELEYKEDLSRLTKDMKCQSCENVCTFVDCGKSRRAFCEPASEQETISKDETTSRDNKGLMTSDQNIFLNTSTKESSRMTNEVLYSSVSHRNTHSSSYTQDVSTKITKLGSSTSQATTNEITPVVYSVPTALTVIIVVVCFLYCRKKHKEKRNLNTVSTVGRKQLSAHFVANTELYEMAINSKLDTLQSDAVSSDTLNIPKSNGNITGEKSGVYEKASGINVSESTEVYNHIWEKDVTIEQKENIYDRSGIICNTENPLYDVTTNKADRKVTLDPTYDHAVHLDNLTEGKPSGL